MEHRRWAAQVHHYRVCTAKAFSSNRYHTCTMFDTVQCAGNASSKCTCQFHHEYSTLELLCQAPVAVQLHVPHPLTLSVAVAVNHVMLLSFNPATGRTAHSMHGKHRHGDCMSTGLGRTCRIHSSNHLVCCPHTANHVATQRQGTCLTSTRNYEAPCKWLAQPSHIGQVSHCSVVSSRPA
jgi:hypothetical protein